MSDQDPNGNGASEAPNGESLDESEKAAQLDQVSDRIDLPHADGLRGHETDKIAARYPTRLIVIAGNSESGKTTLITSLYESFRAGPFGGLCLGDSKTLIGLEKICHENRIESGRSEPDTIRTRPEDIRYYHFTIVPQESTSGEDRQDFLVVAPSGESFREACDSTKECRSLRFLRRADVLLILLDGARLSQPATRQNELSFASLLLRSILDADMLSSRTVVEFVFSKLDCIRDAGDDATAFVAHAQRELDAAFRSRVRCAFREIASRPTSSVLPFSHNLDIAVQSWRSIGIVPTDTGLSPRVDDGISREFHLFARRYWLGKGRSA